MDKLQAMVALGGDIQNVVFKDDLTWPEVLLLRHCHGNASVTDIMVSGDSEREEIHEPERLQIRFGRRYFEVFRLYETNLPYLAPAYVARYDDEVEVVTRVRRDGKKTQQVEKTSRPPPVSVAEERAFDAIEDPKEYAAKMQAQRRAKSKADKAKEKAAAEKKANQRHAIERREQAAAVLPASQPVEV
jgi:hypothetical protein